MNLNEFQSYKTFIALLESRVPVVRGWKVGGILATTMIGLKILVWIYDLVFVFFYLFQICYIV